MPGFYAEGEYDLAGFIVGIVDRERIIDGRTINAGDALIGLPATGLHTNGYSLARRVLFDVAGLAPETLVPELGATVADALLAPHRSYLGAVRPLLAAGLVKGMAHVTGGGITENLPRVLPEGCGGGGAARACDVAAIVSVLPPRGGSSTGDMSSAFYLTSGLGCAT